MSFVIVAKSTRYLERRPYDGVWTWLAPTLRYATHFLTRDEARQAVLTLPDELLADVDRIIEVDR